MHGLEDPDNDILLWPARSGSLILYCLYRNTKMECSSGLLQLKGNYGLEEEEDNAAAHFAFGREKGSGMWAKRTRNAPPPNSGGRRALPRCTNCIRGTWNSSQHHAWRRFFIRSGDRRRRPIYPPFFFSCQPPSFSHLLLLSPRLCVLCALCANPDSLSFYYVLHPKRDDGCCSNNRRRQSCCCTCIADPFLAAPSVRRCA